MYLWLFISAVAVNIILLIALKSRQLDYTRLIHWNEKIFLHYVLHYTLPTQGKLFKFMENNVC